MCVDFVTRLELFSISSAEKVLEFVSYVNVI